MNWRKIASCALFIAVALVEANAQDQKTVQVKGHYRDGHYVRPHTRNVPNKAAAPAAAAPQPQNATVILETPAPSSRPVRPYYAKVPATPPSFTKALPKTPLGPGPHVVVAAPENALLPWEMPSPAPGLADPLLAFQMRNAEKGVPESEYAMGIRYLTGNGVRQDEAMGRELIQSAAKHGSLRAREKMFEILRADRARRQAERNKSDS